MTYASTLTILSGAEDDATALSVAAHFAKSTGGVSRCFLALPTLMMTDWVGGAGGSYITAELVGSLETGNNQARYKTEALVREVSEEEGLEIDEASGRIIMMDEQPASQVSLNGEAPFTDLLIVSPSTLTELGVWSGYISEGVMHARAPLLVARRPMTDGVAAIAWDGGEAAGRAMRAALPLLRRASKVYILQDPDNISPKNRVAARPERLLQYLELHGIKGAMVIRKDQASRDGRLSSLCRELDVDLLVAGAFSHSRLSEQIFGGCTESLVERTQHFNLFLAH